MSGAGDGPSPTRLGYVDEVCDRFEAAWKAGQGPRVEDYLEGATGHDRAALLGGLLALELELRRRRGERPGPQEYRSRFPGHATLVDEAFGVARTPTGPTRGGHSEGGPVSPWGVDPADRALEVTEPVEVPPTVVPVITGAPPERGPGGRTPRGPRFRILRPHAKGGLGEVFIAEDAELHREVALKEIQDRHADDPRSRARFVLEAQLTGGLEHPGIVPVYGLGEYADGRPYYAMRFIRGESLKEAIERHHAADGARAAGEGERALESRRLLGRFIAACNAVAYAHSRGVIHRDLKPANIMLGPFEETLVVDWGLAKPIGAPGEAEAPGDALRPPSASGPPPTIAGSALGTPSYMSPEQAAGRLDEIGPRSDVYSLGATLYALMTGRSPFEGSDLQEILDRVRRGAFSPPRRANPAVPPALDAVCRRAMATRPEDRYGSPADLADDLEHWLADEPVSAFPEPKAARIGRWARRHKAWVVGAASLLLTAVIALAIGTVLLEGARRREREQRWLAESARQEAAERALAEARAGRREAEARARSEEHYYLSTVALAGREWSGNNAARVGDLLNAAPPGRRNWEWHYLKRQGRAVLHTLAGEHVGGVAGLAYSPDGARLVSGGQHGTIVVWDAGAGRVLLKLGGPYGHRGRVAGVAYRPDGRLIASAGEDGSVRIWDAATGGIRKVVRGHEGGALCVAFSPDGARIATGGRDGRVKVWDGETGEERRTIRGPAAGVAAIAFSPDGRRIASGGLLPDGTVRIWDADSGDEIRVLAGHPAGVNGVAFRPDGRRLASAGEDGTVRIWDVEGGGLLESLAAHGRPVRAAAYSPDGRRLATVGLDQCVRLWDAGSGAALSARRGHAAGLACVAFRPDGRRLASAGEDAAIKIWDPAGDQESIRLGDASSSGSSSGPAFLPDGRLFASADGASIRLWDPASGAAGPTLRGHAEAVEGLSFRPDGGRLASVDAGGMVKIWDVEAAREVRTLAGPDPGRAGAGSWRRVALAFGDGGRLLACAGMGGEVKVWDADTGREWRTFRVRRPPKAFGLAGSDALTALAFSRDGSRLAVGDLGGAVRVLDASDGEEMAALGGEFAFVGGLAFSRDGTRLAYAASQAPASASEIRVHDLSGGRPALAFPGPAGMIVPLAFNGDGSRLAAVGLAEDPRLYDAGTGWETLALSPGGAGPRGPVAGLEFSPDGARLVAAGGDGVRIWDASPGREALALRRAEVAMGLAFSPDGARLASSGGKAILVQEALTGRDLLTLAGPDELSATVWASLAFSPDRRTLAAGEFSGRVVLWDATTGRVEAVLEGHTQVVIGLAFGPDGRHLASASHDGTAKVWDVAARKEVRTLSAHSDRVNGVAFSPDGTRLVTGSRDKTVKVWDVASGRETLTLRGHEGSVASVAYGPDGRLLASSGGRSQAGGEGPPAGEVRVWDAATGREVVSIPDLASFVMAVAFTPDGRTIATAGDDPVVRLWDAASGRPGPSLPGHDSFVMRLAFHPGGRFLASGGNDRYVRVWDLDGLVAGHFDTNPSDRYPFMATAQPKPTAPRTASGGWLSR